MKLPFDLAELPEHLHDVVAEGIAEEMYDEAVPALEQHLFDGGARTPVVLLSLAHCLHQDAITCLVDDVEEFSTRALALFEEAVARGADANRLAPWRANIQRSLFRAVREREETAALAERPLAELDLAQMKKVVRELPTEATDRQLALYDAIIAAETPDQRGWYRACRASTLVRARRYAEARPMIDDILARPADYDDHWRTSARLWLLDEALDAGDAGLVRARWQEAALAALPGLSLPWPTQTRVLRFALEHQLADLAAAMAAQMRQRLPYELDDEERALLARVA